MRMSLLDVPDLVVQGIDVGARCDWVRDKIRASMTATMAMKSGPSPKDLGKARYEPE